MTTRNLGKCSKCCYPPYTAATLIRREFEVKFCPVLIEDDESYRYYYYLEYNSTPYYQVVATDDEITEEKMEEIIGMGIAFDPYTYFSSIYVLDFDYSDYVKSGASNSAAKRISQMDRSNISTLPTPYEGEASSITMPDSSKIIYVNYEIRTYMGGSGVFEFKHANIDFDALSLSSYFVTSKFTMMNANTESSYTVPSQTIGTVFLREGCINNYVR